ncbi:MAG: tRNA (adenosine(37)-N6)-threonylcarbamoyltransferase complex dimerization subunit type 1 TsaB, partial [Limisphaerales bacterium]
IGLGPGSYTGIRSAIAIARGWQLARGIKLLGISSAECLAARAWAEEIFGRVNVMIDAQRNEFYLATYDIFANGWKEIEPLRIASLAEIQSRAEKEILAGPEASLWISNGRRLFSNAMTLIRLAARSEHFLPGEKLEPIYLREPNFVKAPARREAVS